MESIEVMNKELNVAGSLTNKCRAVQGEYNDDGDVCDVVGGIDNEIAMGKYNPNVRA